MHTRTPPAVSVGPVERQSSIPPHPQPQQEKLSGALSPLQGRCQRDWAESHAGFNEWVSRARKHSDFWSPNPSKMVWVCPQLPPLWWRWSPFGDHGKDIMAGGSPLSLGSCWWDVGQPHYTVSWAVRRRGQRPRLLGRCQGPSGRQDVQHLVLVPDPHGWLPTKMYSAHQSLSGLWFANIVPSGLTSCSSSNRLVHRTRVSKLKEAQCILFPFTTCAFDVNPLLSGRFWRCSLRWFSTSFIVLDSAFLSQPSEAGMFRSPSVGVRPVPWCLRSWEMLLTCAPVCQA